MGRLDNKVKARETIEIRVCLLVNSLVMPRSVKIISLDVGCSSFANLGSFSSRSLLELLD